MTHKRINTIIINKVVPLILLIAAGIIIGIGIGKATGLLSQSRLVEPAPYVLGADNAAGLHGLATAHLSRLYLGRLHLLDAAAVHHAASLGGACHLGRPTSRLAHVAEWALQSGGA